MFLSLAAEIALRQILKLDGEIFHASAHLADARAENVVEDGSRDGCGEPDGGSDQRFGNAGRNRAKTCAAGIAESSEGVDYAPHGAEETNEWRYRSHRCQPIHVQLELSDFFADSQLQATLNRVFVDQRPTLLNLTFNLTVPEIEDGDQWGGAELLAGYCDGLQIIGLAEGAKKVSILAARAAENAAFREHDGPREQREENQDGDDSQGNRPKILNDVPKCKVRRRQQKRQ